MVIMSELHNRFDVRGGAAKSFEDLENVGAWLHGNDSELIFFIYPN
jgi:hypothetical protein